MQNITIDQKSTDSKTNHLAFLPTPSSFSLQVSAYMATSKTDPTLNPLVSLFKSLGLTQAKALEAAKSPKSAAVLQDLIEKHSLVGRTDEKQASLVVALAGQLSKSENVGEPERKYVIDKILEGDLKSVDQVTGMYESLSTLCLAQHDTVATQYIETHPVPLSDEAEFNQECGIGPSNALYGIKVTS